jgi:hypothetical protein
VVGLPDRFVGLDWPAMGWTARFWVLPERVGTTATAPDDARQR